MGATTFITAADKTDATEAFRELRDMCRHQYGHGGYTGSIAEKDDFIVVADKPMTNEAATNLALVLLDTDDPRISDKRGPAGAIPIKETARHRKTAGWLFFGWASE